MLAKAKKHKFGFLRRSMLELQVTDRWLPMATLDSPSITHDSTIITTYIVLYNNHHSTAITKSYNSYREVQGVQQTLSLSMKSMSCSLRNLLKRSIVAWHAFLIVINSVSSFAAITYANGALTSTCTVKLQQINAAEQTSLTQHCTHDTVKPTDVNEMLWPKTEPRPRTSGF